MAFYTVVVKSEAGRDWRPAMESLCKGVAYENDNVRMATDFFPVLEGGRGAEVNFTVQLKDTVTREDAHDIVSQIAAECVRVIEGYERASALSLLKDFRNLEADLRKADTLVGKLKGWAKTGITSTEQAVEVAVAVKELAPMVTGVAAALARFFGN